MIPTWVGAVLAGCALLVWWPRPGTAVELRMGATVSVSAGSRRRLVTAAVFLGMACTAGLVVAFAAVAHRLLVGLTVAGAFWAAWQLRCMQRARAQRDHVRAETVEAIEALTSEIESGVEAARALDHLAADWPQFGPAAAAARIGGDVSATLHAAAATPGAEALDRLAGVWRLSARTGAAQRSVLDQLGHALREERELQREIISGLGPSRATARLLAALPLLGLALGSSMRGETLRILFDTMAGAVCLAAGVALACVGLMWVERIASAAEQW